MFSFKLISRASEITNDEFYLTDPQKTYIVAQGYKV